MSLQSKITQALKDAMKSKDQIALEALRAIKSELLLAQTSGASVEVSEADEVKLLQKLVKQRRESAAIFVQQNREDLAEPELKQAEVIAQFLPEQLSVEQVENEIKKIISEGNYSGLQDMGRAIKEANALLAGRADGKTISEIVKKVLS